MSPVHDMGSVPAEADDEDGVIPGARTGLPAWVWGVGGVAAAALVVLGVVIATGEGTATETLPVESAPTEQEPAAVAEEPAEPNPVEPAADEPAAIEPVDETNALVVEETDEVVEESADGGVVEVELVTLTLIGVPEGAAVTVDGEPAQGTELSFEPSEEERAVEVRLDGHLPWTRTVPGDTSQELTVELEAEPAAEPEPPQHARRQHRRRGSRRSHRRRRSRRRAHRPRAVTNPGF